MVWESRELLSPVGHLSLRHTRAGITFGDNWVCAYKAHVDQTGAVFPYTRRFDFARKTKQGTTPNRRELLRLTAKCWHAIDGGGQIDYSLFLLCFPQWACTTREVTIHLPLNRDETVPGSADPVVKEHHLEELAGRIAAAAAADDSNRVLLEVVPHCYIVNGRRRMSDPVGTPAHALKLKAHATLADRSCVDDILYCLEQLGIRKIDAILSPFSAIRPHLSLVERQRDVAVVEVDRKSTCYSIYSHGELLRSGHLNLGSYNVLVETAHELGIPAIHLAKWLNKWEHLFVAPSKDGLPQRHVFSRLDGGPRSLKQLNAASAGIAARVMETLVAKIRDANLKHGTSVRELVFMGEDYLSLRALKTAAAARGDVAARWRIPRGIHPKNGSLVSMPGLVRTFGALKLGDDLRHRPAVPVTIEYNRTRVDRVNDGIHLMVRRLRHRARRLRMRHVGRALVRVMAWLVTALSFGRLGNRQSEADHITGQITLQ